ncbi:MAG: NAD(P)H-hydrate epimerase, partial [Oscillospiraceae bacterium]
MLELTKEQMKKAEALTDRAGLSYLEMMYNAGIKAFEYINTQFDLQSLKTVILCGNGNNGGDGFVVAKKMIDNGYNVITVLCSGAPKTKEAQKVFELIPESIDFLENQSLVVSALADADIVIDAVYGTGFRGELSEELDVLFNYANGNTCERISLDLPSGMNADTGEIFKNYFHADITITFGAYKLCHNLPECKSKCGRVVLVDIGIPMDIMFIAQNELKLIDKELVSSVLPKRSAKSHKGNYGNLLNICGSNNMGGAAMMVTLSAMRMGVGKTTLASTKCVIDRCCGNMMEAMTISLPQNSNGEIQSESIAVLNKSLKQSTACLIGCGLGCSKNTREIVEYVIDNADCPIILDADALNVISQDLTILNNLKTPAVITPHIGEMARLSALTIEEVQKSSMS